MRKREEAIESRKGEAEENAVGPPPYAPTQDLALGPSGKFCTDCGIRTEAHWKFCLECGAKTGGGPVVGASPMAAPIHDAAGDWMKGSANEALEQTVGLAAKATALPKRFPEPVADAWDSLELTVPLVTKENETRVVDLVAKEPSNVELEPEFVRVGHRLFYDFERQPNCCCECDCCCDEIYGSCYDGRLATDGICGEEPNPPCFCGKEPFVGCHPNVKLQVPRSLAEKGVTAAEWREWFEELEAIQSKAPAAWSEWAVRGCPRIWLILLIFSLPILIALMIWNLFCPLSSAPCCFGRWHSKLRLWLRKVNERLQPLGGFAKIRTHEFDARNSNLSVEDFEICAALTDATERGNKTRELRTKNFKENEHFDGKYLEERIYRHYHPSQDPILQESFQLCVLVFALNTEETRKLKTERILKSSFGLADWRRVC